MTAVIDFFEARDRIRMKRAIRGCRSMHGRLDRTRSEAIAQAIKDPTSRSWDTAARVLVTERMSLWQAVVIHTDYPETRGPTDGVWRTVPDGEQILTALEAVGS